ncbi:MAG: hypothetical protein ACK5Z2_15115 [Bacteroidota bacterium]|jgi:hypothetical protein
MSSENKGGGFFSGLNPKDKRRLAIAGTSAAALTAAIYFGNKWYKKRTARKAHHRSADNDDPAYFAKQIYMAIDGAGTDEDAILDAFAKMPSKDFYRKVQKSYEQLYAGRILEEDLQDDLSIEELNQVHTILAAKPSKPGGAASYDYDGWSRRLHQAADGMGTDEEEIYRVLTEVPDKATLNKLRQVFQSNWTITLDEMLTDELDDEELQKARSIIAQKK